MERQVVPDGGTRNRKPPARLKLSSPHTMCMCVCVCVMVMALDACIVKEQPKPVVHHVKLCARSNALVSSSSSVTALRRARSWRSSESVDRLITSSTRPPAGSTVDAAAGSDRSSFVPPSATTGVRSVYIDLGEYQTLLKHGGGHDAVYSLPQPLCYGDDTLRAVKLITDKYDTFKRRQMRAISFRGTPTSQQQANADSQTIVEGLSMIDNS